MAGTRCIRAFVMMGVLAVLLAVVPTGAARAGSGQDPTLALNPLSGHHGDRVSVVASGFGRCLPVKPTPPPDSPTPTPSPPPQPEYNYPPPGYNYPPPDYNYNYNYMGPAAMTVVGGTVEFLWDGSLIATETDSGNGVASTEFSVPEQATIGKHEVAARCPGTEWLNVSQSFEVTEDPVVVPNVIGMDRNEAEKALIGAKLLLGKVSGSGEKVKTQSPPAGNEVERGSSVDIDLGTTPVPTTVVVPRLIGRNIDDVPAVLGERGLKLGAVAGKGEIVRRQRPTPGSRVPIGSAVNVSTRGGVVPPVLIRVPKVVGSKVSAARSALTSVGLKLGGTPADDRKVATQRPSAGTLVAAGSVVTVTLAPIAMVRVPDLVGSQVGDARTALSAVDLVLGGVLKTGRAIASQQPRAGTMVPAGTMVSVAFTQPVPWASVAGLLAILLATAAVAARMVRQRLDRRWVRRNVRVVALPPPAVVPTITETDGKSRMPVVRLEPHGDAGTQVLEEV